MTEAQISNVISWGFSGRMVQYAWNWPCTLTHTSAVRIMLDTLALVIVYCCAVDSLAKVLHSGRGAGRVEESFVFVHPHLGHPPRVPVNRLLLRSTVTLHLSPHRHKHPAHVTALGEYCMRETETDRQRQRQRQSVHHHCMKKHLHTQRKSGYMRLELKTRL